MKYIYWLFVFIMVNSFVIAQEDEPFWEYLYGPTTGIIEEHIIDSDDNIYISSNNGVCISTNQGKNWQNILYGKHVYDIEITNYNDIFVLTLVPTNDIFYSTNKGHEWISLPHIWNDDIVPLKIVLDSNNRIYLLTFKTKDCLILYSDDIGKTWDTLECDFNKQGLEDWSLRDIQINSFGQLVLSGFNNLDTKTEYYICIYDFKLDEWKRIDINNNSYLRCIYFVTKEEFFVATSENLLYTTDSGNNWEIIIDQYTYDIFPITEDEYYICNYYDAIRHTTDRGKTWTKLNNGLENGYFYQVSELNDGTLITTGYPGFFYSTDKGESWYESNEGFTACNVRGMSFDKEGNIYATAFDFFKSTDSGKSWTMQDMNGQRYSCVLATKDNTVIIGSYWSEGNMKISRDGGETWKETENWTASKQYITQISTGRIFAGGYSLHYSDDDGETWIESTAAIGSNYSLAENNEGHLLLAGTSGRIYKSTDQGITFEEIQGSQTMQQHPTESGEMMFVKDNNYGIKLFRDYRTTDNGNTWKKEENPVHGTVIARDSIGNFYVCGGIPRISTDSCKTWKIMNDEGLFHGVYNDIEISPDGHIYLAAEYGGIYRSRERYVSVDENSINSTKLALSPPIPNPTTGETKISFQLPESGEVNIKVSDVLGNIIINRSNKYYSQGRHTETFNFEGLPSGVYLISLSAFGEVITEKVEVVK
jgi:photosystem II stability/assembly factor-like uncharacterized protein